VVDRLLDQGRTTLDRAKRVAIYQELQKHFADQAYMIFPYASGATELLLDTVKGYVSIPGAQRLCIMLAVLGFNLLGDGGRDLLDPRQATTRAASGGRQ